MINSLENVLLKYQSTFGNVVPFDPQKDKLCLFDFTATNSELSDELIADTLKFSTSINNKLEKADCKYGIGGYNENRVLYRRSEHFANGRSIHLGIDIWGNAGTNVLVPVGGTVHSFAYNDQLGDYGATIILQHQLDTMVFHTLYGHLSRKDLIQLQQGKYISRGEVLGHFGEPFENGDWPPHLHFQVIEDMRLQQGDYPGVCSISEREKYLRNCPNPDLILNMMKYAG